MCLNVRPVDHLDVARSTASGKLTEQPLPDTALRPADEPIVDGCWRAILGRAVLRQPLLKTCRMPLITVRSSTRSLRTAVGRRGSICRHCSSLSQNRFARIFSAPLTAENQQPILAATHLLGFSPSRFPTCFANLDHRVRMLRIGAVMTESNGLALVSRLIFMPKRHYIKP